MRWLIGVLLCWTVEALAAGPVLEIDFRQPVSGRGWRAQHDIERLEPTSHGLEIRISGSDPYFAGPVLSVPAGQPLLLRMRLKSDAGGAAQVFYFEQGPTEADSVRFPVPAGDWHEAIVPLPELKGPIRLRIDPPGETGTCVIERLKIEPRLVISNPPFAEPRPRAAELPLKITAGELELRHAAADFHQFELRVAGAAPDAGRCDSHNVPVIGWLTAQQEPRWLVLYDTAATSRVEQRGETIEASLQRRDSDGATWHWRREFRRDGDAIKVISELSVDRERALLFAPLLVLHPTLTAPAAKRISKSQALLAGVEYLADEPSSSTADLIGPAAKRLVPDDVKLTLPLMALSLGENYFGLQWQRGADIAAVFDTPDRTFRSGSHALGLIAPGSDGVRRADGELFPHAPTLLKPGESLRCEALLLGGRGRTVVPALKQYEARRMASAQARRFDPGRVTSRADYVRTTAAAWLETPIRDGSNFRHALGASPDQFPAHPAADASWMLRWLSQSVTPVERAAALKALSEESLRALQPPQQYFARVGHAPPPVAPFITGQVAATLPHVTQQGHQFLKRLNADGVLEYVAAPNRPDFGRTHSERHANGMTAQVLSEALQAAAFSGDRELLDRALAALRRLARYDDEVPRGAQTWEIPLHTPDILAAAHLVKAYWLGYELTGEAGFRERAEYWAWTGLSFVYLDPPTSHPIGPYATTPVLGATHWEAPVWIGLPVQWCGLVYADAIWPLGANWRDIAEGITASAIQQNYPLGHARQGLLPDSFNLRTQSRNPSDINPGTLQPLAMRLFDPDRPAYERAILAGTTSQPPLIVHVPGRCARLLREANSRVSFEARSWLHDEYSVLIHGLPRRPRVRVNNQDLSADRQQWIEATGTLILRLSTDSDVVLTGTN